MNRTKLYGWIIIGLLLVIAAFFATHFLHKGKRHRGQSSPMEIVIERLHFDKNQIASYKEIIPKHQDFVKKSNRSLKEKQKQYLSLLKKPASSIQADSLKKEIAQLHVDIQSTNFAHFLEIKALCKPEQMDDFNHLVDDLGKLFGRQKGRKGGHKGGKKGGHKGGHKGGRH